MKQTPEQMLAAARLAVIQFTRALADVEDEADIPLTVACYMAMAAAIALAELPEDFLSDAEEVSRRLMVHEAREFALEFLKARALERSNPQPEYTPRG